MKELDFDELDRAVNSLMTNVSKPQDSPASKNDPATAAPSEPKSSEPPALAASSTSSLAVATKVVLPRSSPRESSPTPSLAMRRGGRFMDVVHPSSDMKKPTVSSPTASREGMNVQPTTRVPSSVDAAEERRKAPAETPATDTLSSTPVKSDWPDPLEMNSFAKDTEQPMPPEATESTVEEVDKEQGPLTSPFLPDTKVEKRPLGGLAVELSESLSQVGQSSNDATVHDPEDQLPALPKDVEPILPEELHKDLVAIESDNGIVENQSETPTVVSAPSSEKLVVSQSSALARAETARETIPQPAGPTSIPQQYREEPSTGDQESGAIYDTDTYHQPLAHPAKKKSGWLWVVWILLILLLGAGGGAALFFFRII